jgi:hypothetical protein
MRIQRLACGAVGDVTRPGQGSTHRRLVELRWSRSTRASPSICVALSMHARTHGAAYRSIQAVRAPNAQGQGVTTAHASRVMFSLSEHIWARMSSGFGASHGGAPHGFLSCGGDPVKLFACARTVWIECSRVRASPPQEKTSNFIMSLFSFFLGTKMQKLQFVTRASTAHFPPVTLSLSPRYSS